MWNQRLSIKHIGIAGFKQRWIIENPSFHHGQIRAVDLVSGSEIIESNQCHWKQHPNVRISVAESEDDPGSTSCINDINGRDGRDGRVSSSIPSRSKPLRSNQCRFRSNDPDPTNTHMRPCTYYTVQVDVFTQQVILAVRVSQENMFKYFFLSLCIKA